ncbi:MAG: 1-acyl-sn-glycerol-3-phosphate acyltransferase [Candidatus Omnitrophica bacterium]|nr:1-acyl-sn-glycerol-3-phosphate acyltransferase [Candidatus Omnitrophota bacterium]
MLIFKTFFNLQVEGLQNLPPTNFIIISNHVSFLDVPAYMVALPKRTYVVAARFLYDIFWIRWLLSLTKSGIPTGGASDKALQLLEKNEIVGLFPEGGISADGKLKEFRTGASLLAYKSGRPIVPAAILGTYKALPLGARFPRRASIKIKIGKPVYVPKQFEEKVDDVYLQTVTLKLRSIVQELIDAG